MYKNILVALDGSTSSQRALDEAIRIAACEPATVLAIFVVDAGAVSSYPVQFRWQVRNIGRQTLEAAQGRLRAAGIECEIDLQETRDVTDSVAQCLLRCAAQMPADLVVMGTRGRSGLRRLALGSVAESFVRGSMCPVLLTRATGTVGESVDPSKVHRATFPEGAIEEGKVTPPQSGGFRRILLCVDSSEASGCAGAFARRLAEPDFGVTIAGVVPDPQLLATHAGLSGPELEVAHRALLENAERAIETASSALRQTIASLHTQVIDLARERGDVAHALTKRAQEDGTDLMIVALRQHHGLVRWLDSSVIDTLSRVSPCAMIVVPTGYENAPDAGFQRILFAIDGSPTSFVALRTGAMLATPDTQIRVIYVVDRALHNGDSAPMALLDDAFVKEGERAIAVADGQLQSLQNVTRSQVSADLISTDATGDDISGALLRDAERWKADLIVMGTHGRRGGARSYLGSVPNRVASLSKVRLMLVREQHDGPAMNAL